MRFRVFNESGLTVLYLKMVLIMPTIVSLLKQNLPCISAKIIITITVMVNEQLSIQPTLIDIPLAAYFTVP